MMKKRFRNFSIFNARVTSTISVSLVLLISGMVAMIGLATSKITRDIKENLGFDIVLLEDTDESSVADLRDDIAAQDFAVSAELFSAEDAMRRWEQETGENIIEIVGVNPFASEISVKVKAEYASAEKIAELADTYRLNPLVEEVTMHADMIDAINRNMHTVMAVLSVIAVALLLISFVLINNTIRLTVYARRFLIHTMKLVGATPGFIRRPFIKANVVNGLAAGTVASLLLYAMTCYASSVNESVSRAIGLEETLTVVALMLVAGMLICGIAALFATNRYLRVDYDDMFD